MPLFLGNLFKSKFHGTGIAYTPVATFFEWTTAPNAVTLNAIGATGNVVAVVTDQYHIPMGSQPTITYTSATTADITAGSSNGLLTAIANGTSVITAHAATGGWSDVTGTATVLQVVNSIAISPASPTVANGTPQVFTKQYKDRLSVNMASSAGAWASSDNTDFPIDSSTGSCTPNVNSGNSVIKYTDTATGIFGTTTITATAGMPLLNPATGQYVMNTNGAAPVVWDAARIYDGVGYTSPDEQWRTLKCGKAPSYDPQWTGPDNSANGGISGGGLYPYGSGDRIDLIRVVASGLVAGGIPVFRLEWSPNVAAEPNSPQLISPHAKLRELWLGRRSVRAKTGDVAGCYRWDTTGGDCVNAYSIAYNNNSPQTVAGAFTITNAITASGSLQTILCSTLPSMGSVASFLVDTAGNQEEVSVNIVDATHIAAVFTKNHSAGISVGASYGGTGFGFKSGPFGGYPTFDPSRSGVGGLIATGIDGGGHLAGAYQTTNYFFNGGCGYVDGTVGGGINDANVQIDYAYDDGFTYDEMIRLSMVADGSGNDYSMLGYYHRTVASDGTLGQWYSVGAYLGASMLNGVTWENGGGWTYSQFTSKNHNAAIGSPRYHDVSEWATFDATNPNNDGSDDPANVLADVGNRTPLPLAIATYVSNTTTSVTCNLKRLIAPTSVPSYATKIRAVIDGVDNSSTLDYTIPGYICDVDLFPITVALTPGLHNIQFKTVAGNGTTLSTIFPATPISVATAAPDTPSASNATAQTGNTLTFPVTAAATGVAATNVITEFYNGSTWGTYQSDAWTTGLGGSQNIVVVGLSPSTAYTNLFRFHMTNSAGASSPSGDVSGTTIAGITPSPITGTILRQHAKWGVTSAAGLVSAWADQSPTGVVFTASGALQPTLVANVYKGGTMPCIRFTASQYLLAATVAALQGTNSTICLIYKNAATGTTTSVAFSNADNAGSKGYQVVPNNYNGNYSGVYGSGTGNTNVAGGTPDTTTLHLLVFKLDQTTGTKQGLLLDGTSLNGDGGAFSPNTTQSLGVGTSGDSPGTGNFNGDLCEILVGDHGLSSTELADVKTYAEAEWGTP